MNEALNRKTHQCDLCIIGGGLSGTIAALAAARHGIKVVLMQDRPVLGGNSSSEIRMWVRGAKGKYNRETGILAELEEENIYRNPTLAATVWDSVLFGKVKENENIDLILNCSCFDADMSGERITGITGWQLTTYTFHRVEAKYFADCSGDSILASLTGALHRHGREARAEYGESIGPNAPDTHTMGMSCLIQARETGHPVKFIPPEWANVYETDEDFAVAASNSEYSTFRNHEIGTSGGNLWWMELGGDRDTVRDAEEVRDELIKVAFGIWDHIKNKGDHGCENWELEWVGFLPGKRESVRYIGEYVLTQNDIEADRQFEDVVAYGGWPMDDHNPKGMLANAKDDPPSVMYPAPSPYQIPYRCLYSKNIKNLFFAGRNISVTHAALSSTRVMGTCSLLGQAMGTAAAICVKDNLMPCEIHGERVHLLQQQLLADGVFLPGVRREVSSLSKGARMNLTGEEKNILMNGMERPRCDEDKYFIELPKGGRLEYSFEAPEMIDTLRIQFDCGFDRTPISPNWKMRIFALKLHRGLDFEPVKVSPTIVKSFCVYADGKPVYQTDNNYHSLIQIPLRVTTKNITVEFLDTHGSENIRIYACDFIGGEK